MIKLIDGEYDDWVDLDRIFKNAEIADSVKVISCDTRDFAIGWNFEYVKPFEDETCGLEANTNEGLRKLHKLIVNKTLDDYVIEKGEILDWLNKLCERTGGDERNWRCFTADVKDCGFWKLKYIRFYRNPDNNNQFIVCNAYFYPIQWRKVIENIKDDD